MWNNLVSRLTNVVLMHDRDEFTWNLDQHGVFSVKSYYLGLINQIRNNMNKRLWKLKTLLKIKFFLWFLKRGVTLTKDNLAKRNWQGNQQCYFCHENKTKQHLFFDWLMARLAWAMVYAAWGISKPRSFTNMFGNWLNGLTKNLMLVCLALQKCCDFL